MDDEQTSGRKAEALQSIYHVRGVELTDDEAKAIANQMGNKPVRAAFLCGVIILGLVAFLIWRFAL